MSGNRRTLGFTLIELTAVIAIIGLIIGVVLAGRSLIHESQVTSVMIDTQRYINATQTFKQKYTAFPGDLATATNYWGPAGGSTGDNYTTDCYGTTSSGSPLTCNGDGDGMIGAVTTAEIFLYWQHLADGQYIQGNFTGTSYNSGYVYSHMPGVNCPLSRIKDAGFGVNYFGTTSSSGSSGYFPASYGHVLNFGSVQANTGLVWNSEPTLPALTVGEAQGIDVKYDDGLPATGSIMSHSPAVGGLNPYCAVSSGNGYAYNTALVGTNLSSYQKLCSLIMITGF